MNGCMFVAKLPDLPNHENTCRFQKVKCPYCSNWHLKKDGLKKLTAHETTCDLRSMIMENFRNKRQLSSTEKSCQQLIKRCMEMRKHSAIQIFVKRDKTMCLEVSPFDTIAEVKKLISDREGIPPVHMHLSCNGKPLFNQ